VRRPSLSYLDLTNFYWSALLSVRAVKSGESRDLRWTVEMLAATVICLLYAIHADGADPRDFLLPLPDQRSPLWFWECF
jgi:hypothetical protein